MSGDMPSEVGLRQILATLATELQDLAETAECLQGSICDLIGRDKPCHISNIQGLQSVDALTQSLGDLSVFADALSRAVPCQCSVDGSAATADLKLSALAARLTYGPSLVTNPALHHIEVFDQ